MFCSFFFSIPSPLSSVIVPLGFWWTGYRCESESLCFGKQIYQTHTDRLFLNTDRAPALPLGPTQTRSHKLLPLASQLTSPPLVSNEHQFLDTRRVCLPSVPFKSKTIGERTFFPFFLLLVSGWMGHLAHGWSEWLLDGRIITEKLWSFYLCQVAPEGLLQILAGEGGRHGRCPCATCSVLSVASPNTFDLFVLPSVCPLLAFESLVLSCSLFVCPVS